MSSQFVPLTSKHADGVLRVVVLGRTGRNFAAGMSGGIAYVLDAAGMFGKRCNRQMVDLEALEQPDDIELVRSLVMKHVQYTGSELGMRVLANWDESVKRFVRPGDPMKSRLLTHPLRAEAGGDEFHAGGKHWASQNDPEWQTLLAWVNGATLHK